MASTLEKQLEDAGDGRKEKTEDFPVYLIGSHYNRTTSAHTSFRSQSKGTNGKRLVRRLIKKNGVSNVFRHKSPTYWERYIRDLANTLVDSRWRWTILSLTSCFLLSWIIFACVWMLISTANGDFDAEDPSDTPCLSGILGFGGFVMFSMETQQTIGYGSRYITDHCPEGIFVMCLQIILGCAICGAMVSIVNAKMIRPTQLYSKNLFSKNAVICLRDGVLCLIFRVRDENRRYAIGTSINAYLVLSRVEGPYLKSIHLEPCGLMIWPLEVVHRITPSSPLYDLSPREIITKRFEIIATMNGTSAITGQCSKTRTSYLSSEIIWGHRFKPCVHYDLLRNCYIVNHRDFNAVEEVLTPLCSAQRLREVIVDITTPSDDINGVDWKIKDDRSNRESVYDNVSESDEGEKVEEEPRERGLLLYEFYAKVESMLEGLQQAIN